LARLPSALQFASQLPLQSASHDALQSNSPGSRLHSARQSALHVPVQLAIGSSLQRPSHDAASCAAHAARTATGSHIASQLAPGGITSHCASASTWISPHASMPACAPCGAAALPTNPKNAPPSTTAQALCLIAIPPVQGNAVPSRLACPLT